MISTLFKRKRKAGPPSKPSVPAGATVWAVGDIHGRQDLLQPLVEAIITDSEAAPASRTVVIFLGDYIDRGPNSRGVLQYLAALPKKDGIEWRFLKGNHEAAMLDFLRRPAAGVRWCEYGGDAALRSYGLRPPALTHRPEAWARLSADLNHKLSDAERRFLENLELSVTIGDYFFAHAGARPGEALEHQTEEDLLWIRRSFLQSEVAFEKVVVHGHTPAAEVYADHRRVGIDTRAYDSGVLTALRLEGTGRAILQAVAESPHSLTGDGATFAPVSLRPRAFEDVRQPA